MAIRDIASAWTTQLHTFPSYERTYIDFRQYIYPPIDIGMSALAYTLVTGSPTQPGSHNLTSGVGDYILPMPTKFTLFIRCLPTFAYTATDQPLAGWYVDANNHFLVYYEATDDTIKAIWKDGGTERELSTSAYTSNGALQIWHNICVAIDTTTGNTAGSALYVNEASADAVWSGNIDAKGMEYPLFSLRHEAAVTGAWTINQVRYFPDKVATAAQVANLFKGLEEEEIVWNLNGEGCGRTRCNVSRHVKSLGLERSVEEPSNGSQGANRLTATLFSHGGEYADDQYADFDPTAEQFNGTVAQKYLQKQARVEAETWYTLWEPLFIGRVDNNLFSRTSTADGLTTVDISAEDGISDIAREMKRKGRSFAGKKLSDVGEGSSLIHLITRLATSKDVYNFLANSSFENTTIGNSWNLWEAGTGATLTRQAGGLFGNYEGQIDYGNATSVAYQDVLFTGTKKLNVGETYTFSVYLKSTNAANSTINIAERDLSSQNDITQTAYSLSGGEGWKLFSVTHTITDSTSDRLRIHIIVVDNIILSMDGAMLVQGERAPAFWALNNNEGAAGVESADDADYASYDTVGFDVDPVDVTHPWVFIPATTSIWDQLKELGNATGCMYLGMDACGTLKLRAKLKTGYTDPSSLETITKVRSVDSVLELARANKIVGHGVKVDVSTAIQIVWMLEACPSFVTGGGKPRVEVLNNGYFPDPTTYGDFFAKYGEVK